MEAHYELTYQDAKEVSLDSFYLMPTSHKSRIVDSIVYPLIVFLVLFYLFNVSFWITALISILIGLLTYICLSKWVTALVGNAFLWKNKDKFPTKYSVMLYDKFLVYKDLQNTLNDCKVPWNSIKSVKEKNNFILLYISTINRVLILKKIVTPYSPTSSEQYVSYLKQKIKD